MKSHVVGLCVMFAILTLFLMGPASAVMAKNVSATGEGVPIKDRAPQENLAWSWCGEREADTGHQVLCSIFTEFGEWKTYVPFLNKNP